MREARRLHDLGDGDGLGAALAQHPAGGGENGAAVGVELGFADLHVACPTLRGGTRLTLFMMVVMFGIHDGCHE